MSDLIKSDQIGYLVRHKASVAEQRAAFPGDGDPGYLWQYTHGTKNLAHFEAIPHLEVKRVYGASEIERLTAERDALRAERDWALSAAGITHGVYQELYSLRADAGRYRWLRVNHDSDAQFHLTYVRATNRWAQTLHREELDAAIDAAKEKP